MQWEIDYHNAQRIDNFMNAFWLKKSTEHWTDYFSPVNEQTINTISIDSLMNSRKCYPWNPDIFYYLQIMNISKITFKK